MKEGDKKLIIEQAAIVISRPGWFNVAQVFSACAMIINGSCPSHISPISFAALVAKAHIVRWAHATAI